jgi:uncharacterized membrane protein YedE/YeeE
MSGLAAFASGLIFGIGLLLSGMADPGKVKGFLDLAGTWDPSLLFVMGGAVVVGFFAFRFAGRRAQSFLGGAMRLPASRPTLRDIDLRLVAGAAVFGIGWGLSGFCPGPALVSFGAGQDKAVVFVLSMLTGMLVYAAAERRSG